MECYLAAVILSLKFKKRRKMYPHSEQNRGTGQWWFYHSVYWRGQFYLLRLCLSVLSSPSPSLPLPLSLSVLTGTSRLSLFADLSWGVDSSHTTWCHSSVKLRRNRHDYQNYTAVICASEEGLLHQLCYISPASVQTTCSSYIVAVSSSFSNSCQVRLICYLIDWHIMFHGYLLGSEKCSNPAKHWRCSLVIIAAFTWQDACVCLEVHNRCAGHNLVPSSDQAKM